MYGALRELSALLTTRALGWESSLTVLRSTNAVLGDRRYMQYRHLPKSLYLYLA
jgi:hypothetical protein